MSQPPPNIFTHNFTITLPSQPHLSFIRLTPPLIPTYLALSQEPLNHPFASPGVRAKLPNPEADTAQLKTAYLTSPTTHASLFLLIYTSSSLSPIGFANIYTPASTRRANLGLTLIPSARGQGVGTATLKLLLRLSNDVDADTVGMGTMKENKPLRALARKLGLEETDEEIAFPGVGVVNDVVFQGIKREDWMGLEFEVVYGVDGPGLVGSNTVSDENR